MPGFDSNISYRLYGLLLFAYPPEFRREFGDQMLQVFRDCYRAEASSRSLPTFWLRTLLDLVITAVRERADSSGREGVFMNKRSDAIALVGSFAIIIVALMFLSFLRRNGGSPFFLFGYALDALIVTGVIGNLIVFLLLKTTKLDPLRIALSTFAVVHAVLLLFIFLVSSRVDPVFHAGAVVIGYVVSFLFWAVLHWAWRLKGRNQALEG